VHYTFNVKIKIRRKLISLFLCLASLACLCSCSSSSPVSESQYLLDTVCDITIYDSSDAEGALEEGFAYIAECENLLSKTRDNSDVSRINSAAGQSVVVSDLTAEVIELALEYSELSDGAFDITMGGVIDLWDAAVDAPPSDADLTEALSHVSYKNIELDGNTVTLKDPETQLDLGGIGKGVIASKTAALLESLGVRSAIVNLGGNVVCIGQKSFFNKFKIGIMMPFSDNTQIVGYAELKDQTAVTSGVYERTVTLGGTEYHHIKDPATGYPSNSDITGATIVANASLSGDCDALSTICIILGSDKAVDLIESLDGFEALFILTDGQIVTTSEFSFTAT